MSLCVDMSRPSLDIMSDFWPLSATVCHDICVHCQPMSLVGHVAPHRSITLCLMVTVSCLSCTHRIFRIYYLDLDPWIPDVKSPSGKPCIRFYDPPLRFSTWRIVSPSLTKGCLSRSSVILTTYLSAFMPSSPSSLLLPSEGGVRKEWELFEILFGNWI